MLDDSLGSVEHAEHVGVAFVAEVVLREFDRELDNRNTCVGEQSRLLAMS